MMHKVFVEKRLRNRVPVCEVYCPLLNDGRHSTEYCRDCIYFNGFDRTVVGNFIMCSYKRVDYNNNNDDDGDLNKEAAQLLEIYQNNLRNEIQYEPVEKTKEKENEKV